MCFDIVGDIWQTEGNDDDEGPDMKSNDFRKTLGVQLKAVRETGQPVTVDHYNIPVAVLVPADWYARAVAAIGTPGMQGGAK